MRVTHVFIHREESVFIDFAVSDNAGIGDASAIEGFFSETFGKEGYPETGSDERVATILAKSLLQK